MAETKEELLQKLISNMTTVHRLMMQRNRRVNDGLLPLSQTELLFVVREDGPLPLKALAERMQLTPGAITQLVEPLERAGYLERTPSKEDRRVSLVGVTQLGVGKLAAMQKYKFDMFKQTYESLTIEELQLMARIQAKMITNLKDQ